MRSQSEAGHDSVRVLDLEMSTMVYMIGKLIPRRA